MSDDAASFREQLAYLLERSPFYGAKLAGCDPGAGLDAIGGLPLAEKHELKATRTADNPFGAHLCVERHELARIYSTSGTTGTPSYIPLPVDVELADGAEPETSLADEIRARVRDVLVVQVAVELVRFGSLRRSDHKSKLVAR
jgi:phenylacetate-coenzyme A ligase PaaK-like adenylate-forming protein